MIRLILCDDHPVVRAGLRAVLTVEPDIEVVAEAASAEEAIEVAAATPADLVLMDLQFGGTLHGADATRAILAAGQSALAPAITSRLLERVRTPTTSLSARELEVLSLVADGKSNAEVAAELFLGEKLGVGSRTAAVNAARQTGLLRTS